MGILVSGTGTTLEAIASAIEASRLPARVVLVVSDRAGAPALRKAAARGLPTLLVGPDKNAPGAWEDQMARHLAAAGCELVVLAGFLRILKGPLMEAFPGRVINLHPSLLPKFGGPGLYGTHVHAAVLASGDPLTGSTVHLVTPEVDRGPILAQRTLEVDPKESPEELSERQRPMERELLVEVIRRFATGELPLPWHPGPLTYAAAGVDTHGVKGALAQFLRRVPYRAPPSHGAPVGGIGLFAGLIRLEGRTFALTTDGVGTKVLLAEALDRWEEVGEDMVAVNVNDLVAAGATPAALVDYVACRSPDARVLSHIGLGLNRGLERARCSLLGGETAVVPELIASSFDLSATAMGFFPKGRRPLDGGHLKPGDILIGLPSSGFHANGYTLIRRLMLDHRLSLDAKVEGVRLPLGRALLQPTRIYAEGLGALLDAGLPVAGAHITGGGFRKNLIRLNRRVEFVLDRMPPPRGIFRWVERLSALPPEELYRTFNMGIGFVVAVRGADEKEALTQLRRHGERGASVIGSVRKGHGVTLPSQGVRYESY